MRCIRERPFWHACPMIFAMTGTMYLDFARLVRALDENAQKTGERTIIQTGLGKVLPGQCEHFDFKPPEELGPILAEARVVATHGGMGCVLDVLEAKRPLIVVPRLKHLGEHLNDHQLDLAGGIERRKWGRVIRNIADLPAALADPPPVPADFHPDRRQLASSVREVVDFVAAGLPIP